MLSLYTSFFFLFSAGLDLNRILKIVGFLLQKLVKYVGCLVKIKSHITQILSLPSTGFLEVLVRHNAQSDSFLKNFILSLGATEAGKSRKSTVSPLAAAQ